MGLPGVRPFALPLCALVGQTRRKGTLSKTPVLAFLGMVRQDRAQLSMMMKMHAVTFENMTGANFR